MTSSTCVFSLDSSTWIPPPLRSDLIRTLLHQIHRSRPVPKHVKNTCCFSVGTQVKSRISFPYRPLSPLISRKSGGAIHVRHSPHTHALTETAVHLFIYHIDALHILERQVDGENAPSAKPTASRGIQNMNPETRDPCPPTPPNLFVVSHVSITEASIVFPMCVPRAISLTRRASPPSTSVTERGCQSSTLPADEVVGLTNLTVSACWRNSCPLPPLSAERGRGNKIGSQLKWIGLGWSWVWYVSVVDRPTSVGSARAFLRWSVGRAL